MAEDESHTVWIMVEDDNGQGGEGRTYWIVETHGSKADAIAHAEQIAERERKATGRQPERLDD